MNQQWGRVAVLMGGDSAERAVSLNSGKAVVEALRRQGVDVVEMAVDNLRDVWEGLTQKPVDRVFNVMHGRGGEDGQLQALLSTLKVPMTGCSLRASALTMDKHLTKKVWLGSGLPTPGFCMMQPGEAIPIQSLPAWPVVVKPALEGSSVGIYIAHNLNELEEAVQQAGLCESPILIERFVEGRELTVAMVNGEILPVIEIKTGNAFYDFSAKYQQNDTQYLCPCELPSGLKPYLHSLAKKAFETTEVTGWGRVDIMLDQDDQPWLLEINTVPGMTDHSLVPMAAKAYGWDFDELVLKVLEQTRE